MLVSIAPIWSLILLANWQDTYSLTKTDRKEIMAAPGAKRFHISAM
jgi:hypothetical protein